MNAGNLLSFNGSIKLIDPSEEGFDDSARDVGRYCASTLFNNYDCFDGNREESIEIARSFLQPFDPTTLRRAKYYIGESFISFMNFPMYRTSPADLKRLAVGVLGEGGIVELLERSL